MALNKGGYRDKVIGILGGMGPEATADLFLRIIKVTPAKKDQDHLRIIIDNNPKIPSRIQAILGKGESPLKQLQETLHNLEKAGAEIIAIPCNIAHCYYNELQESTKAHIVNMISETTAYIYRNFPHIKKVGLLTITGVITIGIYHKTLTKVKVITPDEATQAIVMDAIFGEQGIKAGYTQGKPRRDILAVANTLINKGAEAIMAGCTEVSLVLSQNDLPVPLIDPLQVLAEALVKKAKSSVLP
ncbi:MAG: amino acid racemase [Dehalococcoidales bacterium]|nr:amino acid racemase [Dehalococcoidales bacterium]